MEGLPTPLSRVELYLAKAAGMDVAPPEPESRLELFLAKIAGEDVEMPAPHSLTELWLAWVAGSEPIEPLAIEGAHIIGNQKVDTRYFAVACGVPGATLPAKPQNRKEMYWAYIAINPPSPGVLKYATGTNIHLTDVVKGIEELQYVYGDTFQQTYSGKNLLDNNDLTFDYCNVNTSYIQLSSLPTGIRFTTTYHTTTGSPSILFKTNIDLSPYAGKTIRVVANFGAKGEIRVQRVNDDVSVRTDIHGTSTSGAVTTWTVPDDVSDAKWLAYGFRIIYPGTEDYTVDFTDAVITIDNADMSWEPYTGGIPAPNPDYPQPIQVVTGEQTVTIGDGVSSQSYEIDLTGKNLFDKDNANILVSYFDSSTTTITADSRDRTIFIPCLSNTTYTVSKIASPSPRSIGYTEVIPTDGVQVYGITNIARDGTTGTITTGASAKYLAVRLWSSSQDTSTTLEQMLDSVQIELGPTATSYAPYYNYELCKIGTYQDYIYKSGDDWYVHKACGLRTFSSSSGWTYGGKRNEYYGFYIGMQGMDVGVDKPALSNYFLQSKYASTPTQTCFMINSTGTVNNLIIYSTTITTTTEMNTLFGNEPMSFYYPLKTPTDTQITDATLVGQLNAIDSAVLPKPIAYITVGVTDPNLPAPIKISYYGESA